MSNAALTWARRQCTGRAATKAILLLLADYADDYGSCFPGTRDLATDACTDQKNVRAMLDDLRARGLITWSGEQRKRRTYRLRLDIGPQTKDDARVHNHSVAASSTHVRREQRARSTEGGAPATTEGGAPSDRPSTSEGGAPSSLRAVRPLPEGGAPSYTSLPLIDPSLAAAARGSASELDQDPENAVTTPETTDGEKFVAEWATSRSGVTGRQRAKLATAVNSVLRDGALPDLMVAALDEAHDNPRFHAPEKVLPFAYENVLRARQAAERGAHGVLAAQRGPAGRRSRTDRAMAALAAVRAEHGPDALGRTGLLQLPPTGSDR